MRCPRCRSKRIHGRTNALGAFWVCEDCRHEWQGQAPEIGKIVLYRQAEAAVAGPAGKEVVADERDLPAIITRVHENEVVDLIVFNPAYEVRDVEHVGEKNPLEPGRWRWMEEGP